MTISEPLYFCCFQAEQSQSNILEKALVTEKDNFHRLKVTLDNERIRSRDAIDRDNDTILDLRTALEVRFFFQVFFLFLLVGKKFLKSDSVASSSLL